MLESDGDVRTGNRRAELALQENSLRQDQGDKVVHGFWRNLHRAGQQPPPAATLMVLPVALAGLQRRFLLIDDEGAHARHVLADPVDHFFAARPATHDDEGEWRDLMGFVDLLGQRLGRAR